MGKINGAAKLFKEWLFFENVSYEVDFIKGTITTDNKILNYRTNKSKDRLQYLLSINDKDKTILPKGMRFTKARFTPIIQASLDYNTEITDKIKVTFSETRTDMFCQLRGIDQYEVEFKGKKYVFPALVSAAVFGFLGNIKQYRGLHCLFNVVYDARENSERRASLGRFASLVLEQANVNVQ